MIKNQKNIILQFSNSLQHATVSIQICPKLIGTSVSTVDNKNLTLIKNVTEIIVPRSRHYPAMKCFLPPLFDTNLRFCDNSWFNNTMIHIQDNHKVSNTIIFLLSLSSSRLEILSQII